MNGARAAGVPLCDLQIQYQELQPQIEEAIARVLASGQVILGSEVTGLEAEIAQYCGVGHAVGCGNNPDCSARARAWYSLGSGVAGSAC